VVEIVIGAVWSWLSGKAVAIAAAVIALAVVLREVKTAGRNAEKVEQYDKEREANAKAHEVAARNDARSDADVDRLLRQEWSRD
jgi:hypothetical protein